MASFKLPEIPTAHDGAWGPPSASTSSTSKKFEDIPYAPYSKSDRLGRFADWYDVSGGAGVTGLPTATQGGQKTRRGERGQAYGSGTASAFNYFHAAEDEASFSLVDNKGVGSTRGARGGQYQRGGRSQGRGGAGARTGGAQGGRGGQNQRGQGGRGGNRGGGGGRRGWRDWEKNNRNRESSVVISPSWNMLEEIEFHRLAKLRLDVDDPEDLESYGRLHAYDKTFDRLTTKTAAPLQLVDRIKYNTTTSDDPVIQQLASTSAANVYATDTILSVLMTAPRSVYPWDIVIQKTSQGIFLDKRDGGPFDTVTVNENAYEPPSDTPPNATNQPGQPAAPTQPTELGINSATSLSLEATYINQNFHFQTTNSQQGVVDLANANPFYGPDETDPLASCAYKYRIYDLGITEEDDVRLCLRTEVDAYQPGAGVKPQNGQGLVTIRALNEFDPRAPGAGGAPDWRTKLDSQRGAVVATEMKNNSAKLARWTVQACLAGAEAIKIGYISRHSPGNPTRHVILSTASMRPADFAGQLNVSLANGWGIVRTVVDLVNKLWEKDGSPEEAKYVLVKDPNKPLIRLYSVPLSTFTADDVQDVAEDTAEDTDA
ncbi:eukaryotic translation initiation factor 3 subunit D [Flagelloscypha sp. PMI_526]|nr:eukaryotic translation initiation factor 3 subunit D [Flagelloscypha sp. PMI_526]